MSSAMTLSTCMHTFWGLLTAHPTTLLQNGTVDTSLWKNLYNFAPFMMHHLLPAEHWSHLCKSVHAVQNLWQYKNSKGNSC